MIQRIKITIMIKNRRVDISTIKNILHLSVDIKSITIDLFSSVSIVHYHVIQYKIFG